MKIAQDAVVSFKYTLRVKGEVFDEGNLSYLHGHGHIVPGLEEALLGSEAGKSHQVSVPPEKGYGEHDARAVQTVPRTAFPPDAPLAMNAQLYAEDPEGNPMRMTVIGMTPEVVTLDFNHPLAGSTLDFDVAITEVRAATATELEHGHIHGEGDDHDHGHDDDHDHNH